MEFSGFCGPAYQSRSLSANAQRCVNWFPEFDPSGGKGTSVLYPTPGLVLKATAGTLVRGIVAAGDSWLVVSADTLYRVTQTYTVTALLTLVTNTGPVSFAQAGTQAMLVDGAAGYGVDLETFTATRISDDDFPNGSPTCTALGGYFIAHVPGIDTFVISDPFDCFTWNALDNAAAESRNDALAAVNADGRELFLVGTATTEVWVDTGAADFPFERVQGALIEHGTPAPHSLARLPGALFMLAGDIHGDRYAVQCEGYQSRRITTPAIESEWRGYGVISDARTWAYQQDGHAFYVVTFPTANRTWVYDASTQSWHERMYWKDGTQNAHRAICHAYLNGVHLVGDRLSGALYALDGNAYSDNGDAVRRIRVSPHVFGEGRRMFAGTFEAFFEPGIGLRTGQGSDPQASLRVSRDGGLTYGVERSRSVGKIGQTQRRARWHRCGSARDMVFELVVSDPVKAVVTGAALEVMQGNS